VKNTSNTIDDTNTNVNVNKVEMQETTTTTASVLSTSKNAYDEINERMKQEEQQQSLPPKTTTTIVTTTTNENVQEPSSKNPSAIEKEGTVSSPKVPKVEEEKMTTSTDSVSNTNKAIYDGITTNVTPIAGTNKIRYDRSSNSPARKQQGRKQQQQQQQPKRGSKLPPLTQRPRRRTDTGNLFEVIGKDGR